ncbi:MAG: hypothetical protein HY735_27660 [Verrucomicrobia bacterium]|nr:hypothetical protein [Verrucomicrobiota bacterium]
MAELNLRWPRQASSPIVQAIGLSLLFHLLLFCTLELGYRLGLWDSSLFELLSFRARGRPDPRLEAQKKAEAEKQEVFPVIFVEVDPSQATQEVPKETKYYGARNSLAGNPDTRIDSDTPKISGTQDKVPKTSDSPRVEAMPLQPAPLVAKPPEPKPKEEPPKETQLKEPQPEPKSASKPGDLALAKPAERPVLTPKPSFSDAVEATPTRPRPRRLAQVMNPQSTLEGVKMKQEGGSKRYSSAEGLDVKATPFGTYDQLIIEAIQNRWFDLLEERDFARNATGKVVLTFRLNSNGTVSHMDVSESTVNEILSIICQRAVQDPSPFPRWPNDMKRLVGADYRLVRFTFYYE